jgi:3-phenylpropionate/cinnamic acid dioxygenase small subunit
VTVDAGDRLSLHDLAHRYAAYVDDRDLDGVTGLFPVGAVLAVPEPPDHLAPVREHHGPDGVRGALEALAPFRRTLHEVAGIVLDADSGAVRGRVTGAAHHYLERADGLLDVCWRVRYDDRYVRTADGWRFARRAVHVVALETATVRQVLGRSEARDD